jgi:drug/metabolite transporter (DMT)-like permease
VTAGRYAPSLSSIAHLGVGRHSGWLVWFALIAISVLWGTMGIATQIALREGIDPYMLVTLRMTMASAILLMFLAGRRRRIHVSRHFVGDGFVMALGQVVLPSILFAAALELLPTGVASLLFALVPAATALWLRALSPNNALGGRTGVGLTMALAGAVLVAVNSTLGGTDRSGSVLGVSLIVAAVFVASFHGIYSKRHSGHPLFEVMAPQLLIGTMVFLAPGILGGAMDWGGLSLVTWAAVTYLAVGVTVVPTMVLWWLYKRSSEIKVALVNYLFPMVAIVVGVLWFGERFSASLALGGIVLLAGVAVVEMSEGVRQINQAGLRPCPDLGGIPIEVPLADDLPLQSVWISNRIGRLFSRDQMPHNPVITGAATAPKTRARKLEGGRSRPKPRSRLALHPLFRGPSFLR